MIFANSLDPDQAQQTSGLIWIQSVWHSDGIPEITFLKFDFRKNQMTEQNNLVS